MGRIAEATLLADDLTGALEVGAAFAAQGIGTQVTTRITTQQTTPALVIDTETRHMNPAGAAQRVRELTDRIGDRLIYIKTDSTLRGNIGAELTAVSKASPVLYAPAYPRMGRTVRNGRLFVDGVPVEKTQFAYDALNPVRDGCIAHLFDYRACVSIRDGETDEDIAESVREAIAGGYIAAGPAAVAQAIAQMIDLPRTERISIPPVRKVLVVNGSVHERSLLQIENAEADRAFLWTIWKREPGGSRTPLENAADVGNRISELIKAGDFDALVVFGGDTAYAILNALGITTVDSIAEILPGVPVSRIPGGPLLITKAGGFGPPDLLQRLHAGPQSLSDP
ncbi:MAG: hypothetical protein M3Z36_12205 [Acidobacteriota bacterium]|nr:hypothetical protein [Acidobacteriota bacterium]